MDRMAQEFQPVFGRQDPADLGPEGPVSHHIIQLPFQLLFQTGRVCLYIRYDKLPDPVPCLRGQIPQRPDRTFAAESCFHRLLKEGKEAPAGDLFRTGHPDLISLEIQAPAEPGADRSADPPRRVIDGCGDGQLAPPASHQQAGYTPSRSRGRV